MLFREAYILAVTPGGTQQFNLSVNGQVNNLAATWYVAAGDGSFSAGTPGLYTAPGSIPPVGKVIRVEARYTGCGSAIAVAGELFFNWYPVSTVFNARFSSAMAGEPGGGGQAAGAGQTVGLQVTASARPGIGGSSIFQSGSEPGGGV